MSARCEAYNRTNIRCGNRIADQYVAPHGYVRDTFGSVIAIPCDTHMKVLRRRNSVRIGRSVRVVTTPMGATLARDNV